MINFQREDIILNQSATLKNLKQNCVRRLYDIPEIGKIVMISVIHK